MKIIALIFVIIVFVIIAAVICLPEKLSLGTFGILALTLIVLVLYAYDTNSIARVTNERWMREGGLGTTYSMEVVGEKGSPGRTYFRIHNHSTLIVRAKVNCNFKVYGKSIKSYSQFDGIDIWLVFPLQISQEWFEIESLLKENGRDFTTLMQERTEGNRGNQLTMNLELKFWDEFGKKLNLPARHYHFDFQEWKWIPKLTEVNSKT
jgi:hypothetical protein